MKIKQLKDGRWEFDSGEILGQRIRRSFESYELAETFLSKTKKKIKEDGQRTCMEWLSLTPTEIAEIIRYRQAMIEINGKPDWRQGRKLHVAHLQATLNGGLLTALLPDYIKRKRTAGRDKDYVDRLERELGTFVREHAKLTAAEVGDKHIDSYLNKLGLAGITRANRVRDLSAFFNFAKKRNRCAVNPADLTEPIKIVRKRNQAFSIREIAVMLWVADHHPEWGLVPYIAICLWGSSRVCESFGLNWTAYVSEEGALVFEAGITKPNQERVTENLPPVLLDWTGPYIKTAGPIAPPESTVEWRRSHYLIPAIQKILPHFKWLRNGLRKTSISADYAVTKDAKGTAAKHGTSPEMIFANYRMVMKANAAQQFAQLTRANLTPYLRGLIPDKELDEWDSKFSTSNPSESGQKDTLSKTPESGRNK